MEDDVRSRFLEPRIASPALVIEDLLVAGLAAPAAAVLLVVSTGTYMPAWLVQGGVATRGLLAPTVAHGAGLALCWLLGALASRAYEAEAFDRRNLPEALRRTLLAGSFATGLLIVATQVQLRLSGVMPMSFGNSLEEDAVLIRTSADLFVDVLSEALMLVAWRLYRAATSPPPEPP